MEFGTKERIGNFFRDYIIEMVIALACLAYVLLGVAQVVKTGRTVAEIIASGAMAFIFGFSICRLFSHKGIVIGEKDNRFIKTMAEFSATVEKTIPHIAELDRYCEERNERDLIQRQTRILASAGMIYSKFKDGSYTGKKLNKYERIALIRAAQAKVHKYSTYELMSENGEAENSRKKKSKKQFRRTSAIQNIVNRLLTALIFGYFGLAFVGGFSWANFMWSIIQVAFFLISGAINYVNSFTFVVDEYRGRIVDKMNALEEFNEWLQKGMPEMVEHKIEEENHEPVSAV